MRRTTQYHIANAVWALVPLWSLLLAYAIQFLAECRPAAGAALCARFGGADLGGVLVLLWIVAGWGWIITVPTALVFMIILAFAKNEDV